MDEIKKKKLALDFWPLNPAKQPEYSTKIKMPQLPCLNYLAFLRPAADRLVRTSLGVSRGRSYGFLWDNSIFLSFEERRSNFGLFYSN
jgi:hypothetical protein